MFVQIKHFQDESYDEIKFETFLQEKWKRLSHQKNVAVQAHSSTVGNPGSVLLCYSLIYQLCTTGTD